MTTNTPIDTNEAARILGKSQVQVRAMIHRGEFKPVQKFAGIWLLDRGEVDAKAKQAQK